MLARKYAHCVPPSQSLAVRAEGGGLLTSARWAGYFEWLYQADPPAVELDVKDVTLPFADPPINCGPPSFVETQAVVN